MVNFEGWKVENYFGLESRKSSEDKSEAVGADALLLVSGSCAKKKSDPFRLVRSAGRGLDCGLDG